MSLQWIRQKNQMLKLEKTVDKLKQFNSMIIDIRVNEQMSRSFTLLTKCITKMNETTSNNQLLSLMKQYEIEKLKMEQTQEFIDEEGIYYSLLYYYLTFIVEEAYDNSEDDEKNADTVLEQVFKELDIETEGKVVVTLNRCIYILNNIRCLLFQLIIETMLIIKNQYNRREMKKNKALVMKMMILRKI